MTRLSWFPPITTHDTRSGGELGHNSAFGLWVLSPKWWRENDKAKDVSWAGTLAQERYEWGWRVMLTPLLWLPIFLPPFARWIELMGHAVEIVVARGDNERKGDEAQYIRRAAYNLREYYPKLFGHRPRTDIEYSLIDLLPRAERWVARHPRFIAKVRQWEKL